MLTTEKHWALKYSLGARFRIRDLLHLSYFIKKGFIRSFAEFILVFFRQGILLIFVYPSILGFLLNNLFVGLQYKILVLIVASLSFRFCLAYNWNGNRCSDCNELIALASIRGCLGLLCSCFCNCAPPWNSSTVEFVERVVMFGTQPCSSFRNELFLCK